MKKIRGKKRYYRNLKRRVDKVRLNLSNGLWYDGWHFHIDITGYSNLGGKHRRQHLKLLFELFDNVLDQLNGYTGDYQTWLLIPEDGIFYTLNFETPNPYNKDSFPIRWIEIQWGVEVPEMLRDIVPDYLEIGLLEYGENCYFCRSPKHGILI